MLSYATEHLGVTIILAPLMRPNRLNTPTTPSLMLLDTKRDRIAALTG